MPRLVQDPPRPERTALMAQRIRGGHRPAVEVYWSTINPAPQKYVCPDAQLLFLAYRDVGLTEIPVRVLSPKKRQLNESAVCIYETGEREGFDKTIAIDRTHYQSLFGRKRQSGLESFEYLILICKRLEARIRLFHLPFDDIAYHHTIRAQVVRHRETLVSMRMLLSGGRIDHCYALVRLLYEGFLSHYLDWLSPEVFGPRLSALAEFRRVQARRRIAGEVCPDDPIREALRGLMPILESVDQKARLAPLGDLFYRVAYPSLSFVVHQDYGEKQTALDRRGAGAERAMKRKAIVRWSDAITAALYHSIVTDIGPVQPPKAG